MARVSKRLRFEILRRDGFKCRYCGLAAADTELRIDHVVPEALGGTNDPSNLATACEPCNNGKSSTTPDAPVVDEVSEDALRWSHAMQAAAARMEKQIRQRREQNAFFAEIWNSYKYDGGKTVPLPADWEGAIVRLEAAGLTHLLFEEAVEVAMMAHGVMADNRFRYFCGVAWNMVTKMQEQASQVPAPTASAVEDLDDDGALPVVLYEGMSRARLEEHLWRFEGTAERLLEHVPLWAQEEAERNTRHDWYCAGEDREATRIDLLPDILRHLGDVLAKSHIQREREGE